MGNEESGNPGGEQDTSPRGPADNGVVIEMARVVEEAEEEEAARDGGVEAAEEDEGGNHEGKRHLLVQVVERTKGGRSHVLVAGVGVNNATDDAEDDDFGNGASPQRLGEFTAASMLVIAGQ